MFKKCTCSVLVIIFLISSLIPTTQAQAQSLLGLPEPGTMVNLSAAYQPAILKGITVHKDNPFMFDFLVDVGQDKLEGDQLKQEGDKLIKYFLATLAVPEKDLWVNLSPYEKDRTVPEALGQTDLGKDLLAQDYILKQLTASLIYPEKELGKKFWDRVYAKVSAQYGYDRSVPIPVNTFNKVWIMADKAEVFERNQTAFVTGSHLKIMLEEDYLAANKNTVQTRFIASQTTNRTTQNIIKDIILPELEHEINTGKNFANLRQIFNSIILASWYKNNLKQSLLNETYSNKSTVKGIDIDDKTIKQKIYERYLQAYKKGVFNYIKETPQGAPKKYFSGGVDPAMALTPRITHSDRAMSGIGGLIKRLLVKFDLGYVKSSLEKKKLMSNDLGIVLNFFAQYSDNDAYAKREIEKREDAEALLRAVLVYQGESVVNGFNYDERIIARVMEYRRELLNNQAMTVDMDALLAQRNVYEIASLLHMMEGQAVFNEYAQKVVRSDLYDQVYYRLSALSHGIKEIASKKFHGDAKEILLSYDRTIRGLQEVKKSMTGNAAMLALKADIERFLRTSGVYNPEVSFVPGALKVSVSALMRNSQVWLVLQDELPKRFEGIKQFEKAVVDPRRGMTTFTYSVLSNSAMISPTPTGGIDLKDAGKNMGVRKVGQGVEFELDTAMMARIRKEGIESLTPVILKVEPVANVGALVGLSPNTK